MSIDSEFKDKALSQCVDIYRDFEKDEVSKWLPPSVQRAWWIGHDYVEELRVKERERLKGFQL